MEKVTITSYFHFHFYTKWFWNFAADKTSVLVILNELTNLEKVEIIPICWSGFFSDCELPEDKEDDFNATDDGEPSEETHGASDETQLGLRLDLLVSLDVVKGRRTKVDHNQLKGWRWQLLTWWWSLSCC